MVTLKADDRRRVEIPDAKPGQVFAYEQSEDGAVTLRPVEATEQPSVLAGLKPFTQEECDQCWGPQTDGDERDQIAAAMTKVSVPLPPDDD